MEELEAGGHEESGLTAARESIDGDGIDEAEVAAAVHYLREEVASLQGSIEKLTTELVVEPGKDVESSSETESDDE